MEGPLLRSFPRMELHTPVEVRIGDQTIQVPEAQGNLSVGGLFISGENLPANTPVHVRIERAQTFEAEGITRHLGNGVRGIGIEFAPLPEAERQHLYQLIADLTAQGAPAA